MRARDRYIEQFDIRDYICSDVAFWPLEPRGLHREMLTRAWRFGGSLPNDHDAIQRVTAVSSEEWARCWPQVGRFWRVEGDRLVNESQSGRGGGSKGRRSG